MAGGALIEGVSEPYPWGGQSLGSCGRIAQPVNIVHFGLLLNKELSLRGLKTLGSPTINNIVSRMENPSEAP